MKRISIITFILSLWATTGSFAQYKEQDILAYIEKYKDKAIAEQIRTGVPAAIKLAQGIYETGAGTSELCQNANNHFGIKCKSTWKGATYTYTDDAKDECFRSYGGWESSYEDHSDFLKNNKRYESLFAQPVDDYASWCHGLKKAGYATNPQYAPRLITLIEKYRLNDYTHQAIASNVNMPASPILSTFVSQGSFTTDDTIATPTPTDAGYYKLTTLHGIQGFLAKKGDHLLEYSVKNRIRYSRLIEINELEDAPLPYDMFIYIDRKNNKGPRPQTIVRSGESLHFIAQREGMYLSVLRALNQLLPGEEPAVGQVLELINPATSKPLLANQQTEYTSSIQENNNSTNARSAQYIDKKDIESNQPIFQPEQSASLEQAVSQPIPVPSTQEHTPASSVQSGAPAQTGNTQESELDMMKRRFDKTIYGTSQEYSSGTKVESKEFLKVNNTNTTNNNNSNNNNAALNKPAAINKNPSATPVASGNAQERLRQHMQQLDKSNKKFTPKATGIEGNTSGASSRPRATTATAKPSSNTKTTKGKATSAKANNKTTQTVTKAKTKAATTDAKKKSNTNAKPKASSSAKKKK